MAEFRRRGARENQDGAAAVVTHLWSEPAHQT